MHVGNTQTRQNSPYQPNQGINMAQLGPYQAPIHTHYGQWPQKYDILGFGSTVKRKRVVSLHKWPIPSLRGNSFFTKSRVNFKYKFHEPSMFTAPVP